MPAHAYHRQPRCTKCDRPVERLEYTRKGSGVTKPMSFEPWVESHWTDRDAQRYARFTDRRTGREKARLVTPEAPLGAEAWEDADGAVHDEYPLKPHFLACTADERSPAFRRADVGVVAPPPRELTP